MSGADRVIELPAQPVTIADERIGVNDAIAAALTRWVGSMPTLYLALVAFGAYTALATWWGPLHRIDPYPFPFLLFLDNVAQLVLCLVIMVGQRVLGAAADRRSVQTYERTEAIFALVADLQTHLDRHDEALSRGLSLLESSPHPWIERHRVQSPPQAIDQALTLNGRIAAWLTQRLGSVRAFYLAAGTQVVWIVMAQLGIQRFDPYPFAFMSFLSTLAQLLFMIVIMVGQDVLGRAGDRRSEQTFLDAEAILFECRRMKARLTAQDRIIDSLAGYTTSQVTEQLAQAIHINSERADHQARIHAALITGTIPDDAAALRSWAQVSEEIRESHRIQARRIGEQLAAIGCLMVPTFDPALEVAFDDDEVRLLARIEYERRMGEQAPAPGQQDRMFPDPVAWDELPKAARVRYLQTARRIPMMLSHAGFQVLRDARSASQGPTEADFTAGEWETLRQAMMAAGVLVAIAEGVVDAEEMFALIKTLRENSITHPSRFIRELTAASTFQTGLQSETTYTDYEGPALAVIRSATAIVAAKAPTELSDFRALLGDIAETVADANLEGGFLGIGAQRRYGNEVTALAAVRAATGLVDAR